MTLGIFREIHPEFPPLAETPQEPEWHPEGDVWVHTLMVVDEASKIVKQERLEGNKALTVLLASLCHDIGKPMVTEFVDGRIKSHGHEQAGEEPTKKFLASIGTSGDIRDKVVKLVTNHLIPTMFYIEETVRGKKISDGAIRRLAKRIHPATIHELVLISEADHLGRGEFSPEVAEQLLMPAQSFPAGKWLLERARRLNVEQSRPVDLTRGADWLAFGFKPGSNIGILIKLSNELRDSKDFSREMVLVAVDGIKNPEEAIVKLQTLLNK
jgi:tRNA nucleotidyltransferase (CCA-adding enzyme)